jgi:DNA mismatch repair protein MutS
LGYFIEITPLHEKKVPLEFIRRQGLANALRYTTAELNETALAIESAADKALKLELQLYEELVTAILAHATPIVKAAQALAEWDVVTALATLAESGNFVRPQMCSGQQFSITAGRHPVVEEALRRAHQEFIPNDCVLGVVGDVAPRGEKGAYLQLITGPNMGGKSTFLRQQAVITILAQMGGFVPANTASIGLVDKLFCRVGAADDLARGQSTFMVEMVETASILHQATEKSLVVLDEIGRGTATYDGVSIAWAVAEHLHNVTKCRALFATHYHELTALADTLPRLKNYHAAAKEYQGTLVFLHTIREGHADKSYGIHVAALAGLPRSILARARALLTTLESGHSLTEKSHAPELPLFASTSPSTNSFSSAYSELVERLENIDVDELTPRAALDVLAELKLFAKKASLLKS